MGQILKELEVLRKGKHKICRCTDMKKKQGFLQSMFTLVFVECSMT